MTKPRKTLTLPPKKPPAKKAPPPPSPAAKKMSELGQGRGKR